MEVTSALFSVVLTIILFSSFGFQAFAAQMTAVLIPSADMSQPDFSGIKFITLKYSPGSPLSNLFNGKNEHVTFTMNGTAGGMSGIISAFNRAIATEKQSPVRIDNATILG